jgi:predicted nucleic acid-binding protein
MIVVNDTSAITSLLQIGQEALLHKLYGEVLIPETVQEELLEAHTALPVFVCPARVLNLEEVHRLSIELDLGEAEAIALAKERHADVLLLDEAEGRRVALRERVPIIGLLGVLIQAKQTGHIPSARKLVTERETVAAFRLSEEVKAEAFRKAEEI